MCHVFSFLACSVGRSARIFLGATSSPNSKLRSAVHFEAARQSVPQYQNVVSLLLALAHQETQTLY